MTDRDMLYRAILSYPAEDAPRLIYADEIEWEQPERSEFIRVQCELARTVRNCPGLDLCRFRPCNWCALTRREQDLRSWDVSRDKRIAWFPEWLNWTLITDARRPMTNRIALASRGFISSLTCSFADWMAHHERLFWSPGQTVECPECRGTTRLPGWHEDEGDFPCGCDRGRIPRTFTEEVQCPECKGSGMVPASNGDIARRRLCDRCSGQFDSADTPNGLITQPLTTAQPIERVRFSTTPPWELGSPHITTRSWLGGKFTRHPVDVADGLNEWYCDRWPGVTFEMPELEAMKPANPFTNAVGDDFSLNTTAGRG